MRAVQVSEFGDPDVLIYSTDVPAPQLQKYEVLVQVKAVGVNPLDTYIRSGLFPDKPELPYIPGLDIAGIIIELGSKELEKKFSIGQRVFAHGTTSGAYAELSAVPAKNCFPLPDTLTFGQGAALGIPYLTAYRALFNKAKFAPGQTILVHGASGAVGSALVQLAAAEGLRVFGTAGTTAGLKLVKDHGAVEVFNHRKKGYTSDIKAATEGKGVDIIFEMLADVNLTADCELVSNFGKIIIIGNRGEHKFDAFIVMLKEITIHGVAILMSSESEANEQKEGLCKAIAEGKVNPVIGKEFPLQDANKAHDYIITNSGSTGKVILTVNS